jgi:hypothetical protein
MQQQISRRIDFREFMHLLLEEESYASTLESQPQTAELLPFILVFNATDHS